MTVETYKTRVKRLLSSTQAKSKKLADDHYYVDEDLGAHEIDYWNFVNALLNLCDEYEHIS